MAPLTDITSSWLLAYLVVITLRAAAAETWRGSDAHARSFIGVLLWNETGDRQHTPLYLCAQWNSVRYEHSLKDWQENYFTDIWEERKMKEIYPQPLY